MLLLQRMPIRMPAKRHRVPNAWDWQLGSDIILIRTGGISFPPRTDRRWSWRDD